MILLDKYLSQNLSSLEKAMAAWRRIVIAHHPTANESYILTVCEEVVRRAELLSETSGLRFHEVAGFLLTRTSRWVIGGLPLSQIGGKLPKTLGDLGLMKLAEGGENGEPLSGDELKKALRHKPRIIH